MRGMKSWLKMCEEVAKDWDAERDEDYWRNIPTEGLIEWDEDEDKAFWSKIVLEPWE